MQSRAEHTNVLHGAEGAISETITWFMTQASSLTHFMVKSLGLKKLNE